MSRRVLTLIISLVFIFSVLSVYFGFCGKNTSIKTYAASGSIVLNTRTDWELGTLGNIDSVTAPGSIKKDVKTASEVSLGTIYDEDPSRVTASYENYKANLIHSPCGSDCSWPSFPSPPGEHYWVMDMGEIRMLNGLKTTSNCPVSGGGYVWTNPPPGGIDSCPVAVPDGSYAKFSVSLNGSDYTFIENYDVGSHIPMGWSAFTTTPARYVKIESNYYGYDSVNRWYYGIDRLQIREASAPSTHLSSTTQLDAGAHTTMNWTTFAPDDDIPANTSVNYRFRTSADAATWGSYTASTASSASIDIETLLGGTDAAKRYLQVETTLANTDGASTPTLNAYTANYEYSVLDHVTVSPATASVVTGGTQAFSAIAYDDSSAVISGATFNWSADCGSIDGSGNYTAPTVAGTCIVTAESTLDGVTKSGTATVTVTATPPPDPTCSDGVQNGDETGIDCGGSCSACPVTPPSDGCANVNYIKISPTPEMIQINQGVTFTASAYDADNNLLSDIDFSWQKSAGTLNTSGEHSQIARYIAPATVGNQWIKALACNKDNTINFNVSLSTPTAISISVSPDDVYLSPGAKQQYTAKVTNQDGVNITSYCPVTWTMQTPTAGTISTSGLLTAANSTKRWQDSIKATASCFGLSEFDVLSFTTATTERRLDYLSMSYPTLTAKKGTIETFDLAATALDQFGAFLPGATYSWEFLDQQIGSFSVIDGSSRKINIKTSDNYGCYWYKVKATASYNGVTLSNFSSVLIYPADYKAAYNGCQQNQRSLGQQLLTALTGAKSALAGGQELTNINVGDKRYLRPNQVEHFIPSARDQLGNPIDTANEFVLLNSNAGALAKDGTFIATNIPGTYNEAIEIKASSGGKTLSQKVSIIVSNDKPQAVSFNVNGNVKIAPNSYYWLYVGLKNQYGETVLVNPTVKLEDVSGENLFGIENTSVIKANGVKGSWKKAIKVTVDLEKLNLRISDENNKWQGLSPTAYVNLEIDDKYDNPETCFSQGLPCNPEISDCGNGAGSQDDDNGGIKGLIGRIIDSIADILAQMTRENLVSVIIALIALGLSLLALALSALVNLLAYIRPNEILSLFVKGKSKKHAAGIVYDSSTGLPIPLVRIILFRARDKKLIRTVISDKNGRFALETPPGGEYYIEVQKEGFGLISQDYFSIKENILAYENNYAGGIFRPAEAELVFPKAIPLVSNIDSVKFSKWILSFETINKVLRVLNYPLIIAGVTLAIFAFIKSQSVFSYIVLILYVITICYLIYKLLTSTRMFGVVTNSKTGAKVDLAVIRAISETSGKLVRTSVSNAKGRYLIILPKGYYKVLSSKSGLEQSEDVKINAKNELSISKTKILMSDVKLNAGSTIETGNSQLTSPPKKVFSDSSEIIEKFSSKQQQYQTPDLNNLGISHLISDNPAIGYQQERKRLKTPNEIEPKEKSRPNWQLPNNKSPL
ncbi:MAG: carboxypeptidase-like regulatory domain-containing protein [Patescibacteria group bacterium]